jgi:hypothetical protein
MLTRVRKADDRTHSPELPTLPPRLHRQMLPFTPGLPPRLFLGLDNTPRCLAVRNLRGCNDANKVLRDAVQARELAACELGRVLLTQLTDLGDDFVRNPGILGCCQLECCLRQRLGSCTRRSWWTEERGGWVGGERMWCGHRGWRAVDEGHVVW